MDMSVEICAGAVSYNVTITDTGYDALSEVQRHALVNFLALVGEEACKEAAKTVPVIDEAD